MLCNKRGHGNEKPAHCNKDQPPLPTTRESLCAATETGADTHTHTHTHTYIDTHIHVFIKNC